jgi:hypothetical protein
MHTSTLDGNDTTNNEAIEFIEEVSGKAKPSVNE